MRWRFIPFESYDPFLKTALNQVAIDSVKKTGVPIVWLAGWTQDCINIGYGQKVEDVVDLDEARKRELPVVRRQGGGGAMFLSKDGEVSWSMVAPQVCFPEDVNEIYTAVCGKIIDALGLLGVVARHKPINDVVTSRGKISGATVKKDGGVVYVAGTLLVDVDETVLRAVLRPERDSGKRRSVPEKEKRVTAVRRESDARFDKVVEVLGSVLLRGKMFMKDGWSRSEREQAILLAKKYQREEWLFDGKLSD